jgi:hypothetical protein
MKTTKIILIVFLAIVGSFMFGPPLLYFIVYNGTLYGYKIFIMPVLIILAIVGLIIINRKKKQRTRNILNNQI